MTDRADWNPGLYLRFGNERTRPSVDLVNRIVKDPGPGRIVDFGCGPGNSARVLLNRWPGAALTGVDISTAMIARARSDFPSQTWALADASLFEPDEPVDLIFSSALIQWIPDHDALLPRWMSLLAPDGVLAVQVPLFHTMPVAGVLASVSRRNRWKSALEACGSLFTYHEPGYYYDLLTGCASEIDLWVTDYHHVLESPSAILDWIRATAMKPCLDGLESHDDRQEFEALTLEGIVKSYPVRPDGRVLFPFKRLFFVARAGM